MRAQAEGGARASPRLPVAEAEYWKETVLTGIAVAGLAALVVFVPLDVAANRTSAPFVLAVALAAAILFSGALARRDAAYYLLSRQPSAALVAAVAWGVCIGAQGLGRSNANLFYPALTAVVATGVFGGPRLALAAAAAQIGASIGAGALLDGLGVIGQFAPLKGAVLAAFLGTLVFALASAAVSQRYERELVMRALLRQSESKPPSERPLADAEPALPRPSPDVDAVLRVADDYALTAGELQVFISLMHGMGPKEIALDLHKTPRQIRRIIESVRLKIGDPAKWPRAAAVGDITTALTELERPDDEASAGSA